MYQNPYLIIDALKIEKHKIAACIQLQGGARSEAVTFIKKDQLKNRQIDKISNKEVGVLLTKEKGGKVGDVLISLDTYNWLQNYFLTHAQFRLKYQSYADDIRCTCKVLNIKPEGTHGFRWTFAQNRIREYQNFGYSYEQALQGVSWEMKHYRASISEHYLS